MRGNAIFGVVLIRSVFSAYVLYGIICAEYDPCRLHDLQENSRRGCQLQVLFRSILDFTKYCVRRIPHPKR